MPRLSPLDLDKLTPEQKLKKHFSLGVLYYVNKDYNKAIEEYMAADAVKPEANTFYNLACAYNLLNDRSGTLFYLDKAVLAGFKDIEALKKDADLASLSATKEMAQIIDRISGRPSPAVNTVKSAAVATKTVMTPQSGAYTGQEKECFDLVNAMRAEKGLKPLAWANDLMLVARKHSADMATRSFFDHTNPDGLDPFQRMENGGASFSMAGENIAYNQGYQDPAAVAADGWRHSPGHYRNIMTEDFEESAIGAATAADGSVYFTQVFIKRK